MDFTTILHTLVTRDWERLCCSQGLKVWHVFQDKGSSQGVSQRSSGPSFRADPKVIKRLHRLEKHMRENKLRHTFADQLGEAQESDELNSKKEARKLAFYLFWNVRPNFDRYNFMSSCLVSCLSPGN